MNLLEASLAYWTNATARYELEQSFGRWRWRLIDHDGNLVALCGEESFPTEAACRASIGLVKRSILVRVAAA